MILNRLARLAYFSVLFLLVLSAGVPATAQAGENNPELIQPDQLARIVKSPSGPKPLIIQVGFRVLYAQAHIPGSEYIGPLNSAAGLEQLRKRVDALPHAQSIVLYCGCCPWSKCPNVRPAYSELRRMGFRDVKVLYIATDFGTDWVGKGYPVARGQ